MKSYSEAFQSAKRESTHIIVKDTEIFGDEEFDAYLKLDAGNIQFVFPKKKKIAKT